MVAQGFFVVIEGLDGSGKGTMVREAKKFLLRKGIAEERIFCTAEPTHGYFGKKLREMLSSSIEPNVNARQFLDLYVSDRKEHLEKEILPALKEGKIVLCDRYKYSTFVYQQLQGISLEKIAAMHEGMQTPDLAIILDIPVDDALKRIGRRKKIEVFERREFMQKVRQCFLQLKEIFPQEDIVFIDASRSVAQVSGEISKLLCLKLGR